MLISALRDSRNEKYPIYYMGILAFVITVCLPLNFGVSKLPPLGMFLLFVTGFVSLFMIVRNDQVGLGLLNHLKIPSKETPVVATARQNMSSKVSFSESQVPGEDPFSLLQNVVERIILDKDDYLDLATRVRLEALNKRLREMSMQICKT